MEQTGKTSVRNSVEENASLGSLVRADELRRSFSRLSTMPLEQREKYIQRIAGPFREPLDEAFGLDSVDCESAMLALAAFNHALFDKNF